MNIKEVAKLAGVSTSTVSKVINGKDKDISEKTRRKVLEIVETANYVPYLKYLEKDNLKNAMIGLIIRRDHREREEIVMAAEAAANRHGYQLLIRYIEDKAEIPECMEAMVRKKAAGVILDAKEYFPAGKLENRMVYLNRTEKFDERQPVSFYYCLSEAGKLAVEYLIKFGHQRIACIAHRRDKGIVEGYRAAMRDRDLPIRSTWIYEGERAEDIEKAGIEQCLNEKVTAVICGSREIVCSLCKILERNRITVPGELSVISVGDDTMLEILGDGITAVKLPAETMGNEAVTCLLHMIGERKQMELMKKFNPSVIERRSVREPVRHRQGEKIVVVGTMNLDITIEMSRIPIAGETQIAKSVHQFPGGKGGNQAIGVGKLGGQIYIIGCLGNDRDGRLIYESLLENNVRTDGVVFDNSVSTGKAYINLDQNGESTIVVYRGANQCLNIEHMNRFRHLFHNARYCLLPLEIAGEIADYTIRCCNRNGTEVIMKPSNVESVKDELLGQTAYIVPNENELHMIVPGSQTLEEKAQWLLDKGVKHVIVTLGERGCYLRDDEHSLFFPGTGFEAVDTTGGADSFISALAVYLSEGRPLLAAIRFAIYASGISVTRYGVQPALPDRRAVDVYEDEIYG